MNGVESLTRELFQDNMRYPAADVKAIDLIDLSFCQKLMRLFGITRHAGVQPHRSDFAATLTVEHVGFVLDTLTA